MKGKDLKAVFWKGKEVNKESALSTGWMEVDWEVN